MKKLLIIAALFAVSCSDDLEVFDRYILTIRDTCEKTEATEYFKYEVDASTYYRVLNTSFPPCGTVSFTDITGEEVSGIYNKAERRPERRAD